MEVKNMSELVTIEIPDHTAQVIREIAAQTGREADAVLYDLIEQSVSEIPLSRLSDEYILTLTETVMDDTAQVELNSLMDDQQQNRLDATSRQRLNELLHLYRRGLSRKTEAIKIATQRGLLG
jgi:hypothetical protein